MNLKKILLSSVAAVALTSVAALAADDGGVVRVAQDQTGDYLVFPAYFANPDGWSTNIKVVNTNTTAAVVAKVVIREYANSAEKLDFPIYLTPGDVWEGTLKNVDGKVYVTSTDDSMFVNDAPASTVNPVNQVIFGYDAGATTALNKGYVEVFGIASIAASAVPTVSGDTAWVANAPLGKKSLRAAFNSDLNQQTGVRAGTLPWVNVDNNSIYGQEVISAANTNGNLAMTLMATAFENVTGALGAYPGVVVKNDTTLASNLGDFVNDNAIMQEIENALQKSNVYVTYYEATSGAAETSLLLNQPMKKYRSAGALLLSGVGYADTATSSSDLTPTLWKFSYQPVARNQTENSLISSSDFSGGTLPTYTCNYELCQVDARSFVGSYANGYVDFGFNQGTTYPSMPLIPAVMTAKSVGGSNVTNIVYPAYKYGTPHTVVTVVAP